MLGDALPYDTQPAYGFNEMIILRFAFDLTFFIIITIIGLNVVFGIIVDTFSELRSEKAECEDKMTGSCFICGLGSQDFERSFAHFLPHCLPRGLAHCAWWLWLIDVCWIQVR